MMTCPLAGEERIMSIESLVRHFSVVEDPRCQGKIEHRLIDILVIAVCAVIACAESWDDIALYGRSKLAWLRTFLDLPNGIPSHGYLPACVHAHRSRCLRARARGLGRLARGRL